MQDTYYVALSGNDDSAGTESEPFRSVAKARDVIRTVNGGMTGDITVFLREGTHTIESTIEFDHRDSGTNGFNVVYASYPGERATISGGCRIGGWQEGADGRWTTSVELDDFRHLYVNGRRAVRARMEPPAGLQEWSIRGYKTQDYESVKWTHPEDVEFCYYESFCHTRCKVGQVVERETYGYTEIRMLQPHFSLAKAKAGRQATVPVYLENAIEFLTDPGEWYFDKETHTVYYIPVPGEDMASAEVSVPIVERLVDLRGTLDEPVQNIRFADITFADATWLAPNRIGLVDLQANFRVVPGANLYARDVDSMSPGIALLNGETAKTPSNIVCHAAKSIHFTGCKFIRLGSSGIDIEYGSQDNMISGCEFCDISGSAIQVGDVLCDDHHPKDERSIVRNNVVRNCHIHDVAVEYMGGVGIFAGYTDGTVISHNELCNLPYSGISVGWGWGEPDAGGGNFTQAFIYDTPTPAKNNIVEYNHIHAVTQKMNDGAGIYTLGRMPGTVIRGNYIHDNIGWYGGIYLDEGSAEIEVVGNVVHNQSAERDVPMKCNNYAQDRITTCDEHDNYFASKREDIEFPDSIPANAGVQPETSLA